MKSNRIKQHLPGFMDPFAYTPKVVEFNTQEELFEIPWVRNWEVPISSGKLFYRWSLSDSNLMAEFDEGYSWYVVGYILNPDALDLPKWEARYREKERR